MNDVTKDDELRADGTRKGNIIQAIQTSIKTHQQRIESMQRECSAMTALILHVPEWLKVEDCYYAECYSDTFATIDINGGVDAIRRMQKASGLIFKREMSYMGDIISVARLTLPKDETFEEFVLKLTVHGDIPLARGCKIVEYETSIKRQKVVCGEGASLEDPLNGEANESTETGTQTTTD